MILSLAPDTDLRRVPSLSNLFTARVHPCVGIRRKGRLLRMEVTVLQLTTSELFLASKAVKRLFAGPDFPINILPLDTLFTHVLDEPV